MSRLLPLLMIVLLSGCISDSTMWERVGVSEFEDGILDNPDGFLLDVRTQAEWEQDGHLENATLIPHTELESRESELPSDKEELILLYCRSGNRSQDAAQTLLDMGFTNLMELETGINGWKDAGMPVVYP
jgi:phage shock protein E